MDRRLTAAILLLLTAVLPLSACADTEPSSAPTTTAATSTGSATSTTASTTSATAAALTPMTRALEGECSNADYSQVIALTTLEHAWTLDEEQRASCTVTAVDQSTPLAVEVEAMRVSGSTRPEQLYAMCAQGWIYPPNLSSLNEAQATMVAGVLTLCPGHSDTERMDVLIANGRTDATLEATGRLFASGTFLVGSEIQPGTYYSELTDGTTFDACHWQVLDAGDAVIDSGSGDGTSRIEVTIPATARAFSSEGCGAFRPVG